MNIIHADPLSTAIEEDELPAPTKSTTPKRKSAIPPATGEEHVRAIDAMAACMLEASFGG